ncbi:MAG: SCO family protein [Myxococcales bacterium]|nr:SCO family protein [Myxococcales bacterium]
MKRGALGRAALASVCTAWLVYGCGDAGEGEAQGEHTAAAHDHAAREGGDAPLADRSVYQLADPWVQANGEAFRLAQLRGHPVLVLLFYGTCEHACPILVHDLQRLDAALDPEQRVAVRYLLVSFDPERDTPERLAAYAREHGLDPPRWTLLHGDPDQIRALALVLGIRYRPTGDGGFSHTSRITLLDREGVVRAQIDGLERPQEPLLTPLRAMFAARDDAASP